MRTPPGLILATTEGTNRWETVLGTRGRSGEQWDIWQAVFSPVGPDGYPAEIWNQVPAVINQRRRRILEGALRPDRHPPARLENAGPKLVGKLHVQVGTADTFYLDHAVHLMQAAMEATANPHYAADFDYGVDQPHCYTGPPGSTTREGGSYLHPARPESLRSADAQNRSARRRHIELALLISSAFCGITPL